MAFNWHNIRALNGSQTTGFEELCAQLARAESPPTANFIRKGSPDAGVECFCILPSGSEWGWQAKYFHAMGNSQWSQLDRSVKAALDKHCALTRYFVCIPLDRPDARTNGRKSMLQRWDERVEKWRGWAQDRKMSVKYVWWGSSELIDRLSRSEHVGRRYFWFGQPGFDKPWFQARLDEAVSSAGPRYSPEIHVELPIARDLERFGRSESVFNEVKSLAREIWRAYRDVDGTSRPQELPDRTVSVERLLVLVNQLIEMFARIEPQPIGQLPFSDISGKVEAAKEEADRIADLLRELEHEDRPQRQQGYGTSRSGQSSVRERRHYIRQLQHELDEALLSLQRADRFASGRLMVLKGDAGTGKTHLLCDFARRRIASGMPTVLLMGQRFVTDDAPWTQALQHLDLTRLSAEEFVGALEAAAQAADCRALLIVDALNEGQGRVIWPAHLAAFLSTLHKSPWIGVLLAVRSQYENVILPEDVREQAVDVTHEGFDEHQYDATHVFFEHYGLEFPSTPILQPEFSNPLFLKALCRGLKDSGKRRLPRGFHGITAVFDLYFRAVNACLAESLDFNPGDQLVRQALEKIADQLIVTDKRWLERREAETLVNQLLPGREFGRSLYRALVVEGVLTEEMSAREEDNGSEVVRITYDRFTDHIIVDSLLSTHLDVAEPAAAFEEGGPLAFLRDRTKCVPPGLTEAFFIQVPEKCGQELAALVPELFEQWYWEEFFIESIIWRSSDAFSCKTREMLDTLIRDEQDAHPALEALLTVATVEGHPLNAYFLDDRLRKSTMPGRDGWWSTFLHWTWEKRGAVDRYVDWVSNVSQQSKLDDSTVDLCAVALAWMLTTSNRFLRDRVTKALVSMLTGRLDATARLVDRFADVDDPYVTERVYAVAYGVAMHSTDPVGVGELASCVYKLVFATGTPPVHILLRDYARGVVERAIYLKASLDIDECLIRPPYNTTRLEIPDEHESRTLMQARYDVGNHAKHLIIGSVMVHDFGHYVIGERSPWLTLRLDEEQWQSPRSRLRALEATFNAEELLAWEEYRRAENEIPVRILIPDLLSDSVGEQDGFTEVGPSVPDSAIAFAEERCENALERLRDVLRPERLVEVDEILQQESESRVVSAPRFDPELIKRYVLWRVFDLGWTTERFGRFDQFVNGNNGREASKVERIGKKYQWIAYHEILASIADHQQYVGWFGENEGVQWYSGPWQEHLRDLDPSCTLRALPGGTSWGSHFPSWWARWQCESWDEDLSHRDWIRRDDNIPTVPDLLSVEFPSDGTRWLNLDGSFLWRQGHPADVNPSDADRRECYISCTAYFVRAEDCDAFMQWAKTVDYWGRWMPEPAEMHRLFLGEFMWSPAFRDFIQSYDVNDGWTKPGQGCPVEIQAATLHYSTESGTFDCSVDDSFTLRLPSQHFTEGLGLKWSGVGADYVDSGGNLAAFDPTAHEAGPSALLVREDVLRQYLQDEGLALCWIIIGERQVLQGAGRRERHGAMTLSGAYEYTDRGPVGFIHPSLKGQDVT